jgi:molybdopterin synthase sulfur carrier subunit
MVKLVFLGKFRGLAPKEQDIVLPPGVATLADLKEWLIRREPGLGEVMAATRTQLVRNQELIRDLSCAVSDGDEIAFLPPMSGG